MVEGDLGEDIATTTILMNSTQLNLVTILPIGLLVHHGLNYLHLFQEEVHGEDLILGMDQFMVII